MASEAKAGAAGGSSGRAIQELPDAQWTDSNTEDAIEHAIQDDPDLADIASRLDRDVTLDPDRDLRLDADGSDTASDGPAARDDSDSISTSSSHRDVGGDAASDASHSPDGERKVTDKKEKSEKKNGTAVQKSDSVKTSSSSSSRANGSAKSSPGRKASVDSTSSKGSEKGKSDDKAPSRKNPLQLLRRLTKFDKTQPKKKPKDYNSEFAAVVVDRLPQVFVVKYLGHRQVQGVCGLHHVRRPVDEMVKAVKEKLEAQEEVELPLLYVVVSPKGLDLREHKRNKISNTAPLGVMPIDFISYGVQDIKYWRVFTCIVVRELSSRSRTATCHVFLCDSTHNGRKMALALGAAFNVYSKKLKSAGKEHNFQIELRPPDELADAVDGEFEA